MILAAGVSTGIGISKARLFNINSNGIQNISAINIVNEIAKLDCGVEAAIQEIKDLSGFFTSENRDSVINILNEYLNIINSHLLIEDIKNMIREENVSAEYAITYIMDSSKKLIEGLDDEYLNEKAEDIEEIKHRLLSKITGDRHLIYKNINDECIVVADDVTPGDVLSMNPMYIKGIVTMCGGPTSSSSKIARRMNIPAVTGVGYEGFYIKNGDMLIVDGNRGEVIINPDDRELRIYTDKSFL